MTATAGTGVAVQQCAADPATPVATTTSTTSAVVVTSTTTAVPTSTTSVPGSATVAPSGGDDTAVLVAAVKANSTVTVSGHLLVNGTAELAGLTDRHIVFAADGALVRTIRPAATTAPVVLLTASSRIVIDDLRIVGPNIEVCDYTSPISGNRIGVGYQAKYEEQAGLSIFGGNDITVNGAAIYGMNGDGVAITYDRKTGANASHVTLNDVATECTGRASISNTGSDHVTVNRGTFRRAGIWIVNIEPFTVHSVSDYTLNQPTIGFSNQTWLFASGPNFSCKVTAVIVRHPIFEKPPSFPPTINGCIAGQVTVVP